MGEAAELLQYVNCARVGRRGRPTTMMSESKGGKASKSCYGLQQRRGSVSQCSGLEVGLDMARGQ